jgi:hypothetical protein
MLAMSLILLASGLLLFREDKIGAITIGVAPVLNPSTS